MISTARLAATTEAVRRASAISEDVNELFQATATAVRHAVPYNAAVWTGTDPATKLFTHGHIEGHTGEMCAPWFNNELSQLDVHKFRELQPGRAALGHDVEDRASTSPRYSELMQPIGYDDELRITCGDDDDTWAAVELQRLADAPPFDADEVALVESIAPMLAAGVRRLVVAMAARQPAPDGPGIVRVRADGRAMPLTEPGAAWLELMPTSSIGYSHTSLLGLARLGHELAAGRIDPSEARLRTRTVDGRWLTLHAQPAIDEDGVLVVLEPSHPSEIADVLARAHGLTTREQEVVLSLSRGASTKAMANELFLSQHTVRDHLKAAMSKVGVSSRGELLARLFEQHYAAGLFSTVTHQ